MARAFVTITCKKCGKNFDKIRRNCWNRAEADSWERWFLAVCDTCPKCYRKERLAEARKQAEEEELEKVRVKYSLYKNSYRSCLTVEDTYDPETKTVEIYATAEQREEMGKL